MKLIILLMVFALFGCQSATEKQKLREIARNDFISAIEKQYKIKLCRADEWEKRPPLQCYNEIIGDYKIMQKIDNDAVLVLGKDYSIIMFYGQGVFKYNADGDYLPSKFYASTPELFEYETVNGSKKTIKAYHIVLQ